jgi:hypothetical protein
MKPSTAYFYLCVSVYALASSVGVNFALTYVDFVHVNNGAAWRPGIGIALLFTSMTLSFVGHCYSWSAGRVSRPLRDA